MHDAMFDFILLSTIASKLYGRGSVGYVSKSGGMSNELDNILTLAANGTYEAIAVGGDPGAAFIPQPQPAGLCPCRSKADDRKERCGKQIDFPTD